MCLILFAHDLHPRYPLMLAANRDEYYDRATAPAGFWEDAPSILAGRDEIAGGTWLGVTRSGHWAAITNYRSSEELKYHPARSRGLLVSDFLLDEREPADFLSSLSEPEKSYRGYNLLAGSGESLAYYSNRGGPPRTLPPGCYGLSNHLLDTDWAKVSGGKAALAELLRSEEPDEEELFAILADTTPAQDFQLPDTGFGPDWERTLSPRFIRTERYGTRSSTLLLIDREGVVTLVERTFDGSPQKWNEIRHRFSIA